MSSLEDRIAKLSPEKLALLTKRLAEKAAQSPAGSPSNNGSGSRNGTGATKIPVQKGRTQAPLSFTQQGLWFLDQLEAGSAQYVMPAAVRLEGRLSVAVLERSLSEIIQRHDILRTRIVTENGEGKQVIAPFEGFHLPVIYLAGLDKAEREAETRRMILAETQRKFDLANGPLIYTQLLRLNETEHVLLLTMHHIISDGWSMTVLVRELSMLYSAYTRPGSHTAPALPELPLQYADYAEWQRSWLESEAAGKTSPFEKQVSYWQRELNQASRLLELPTDFPRPAVQSHKGGHLPFVLSPALTRGLRELSQREGATLFMTLLAAFQVLLSRYAGQEDICVGTPVASRTRPELESLIGFFANTLVIHSSFHGAPSFREALRRVREASLGAFAHQDLPFDMLVEKLNVPRSLSYTPLFQVMFSMQDAVLKRMNLPGLSISLVEMETGQAKFDLLLNITDDGETLSGYLEYASDLFEAATIQRMQANFETLLNGLLANPDGSIATLPLISTGEQQALAAWNSVTQAYPADACIHQRVEAVAQRDPQAIAAFYEGKTLTYAELNRQANRLAHTLIDMGVGPNVLVAFCMERSVEMIVALLAAMKAGGAYLPLDPTYPTERIAFVMGDAKAPVLLTQSHLLPNLPQGDHKIICLDTTWESPETAVDPARSDNPVTPVTAEDAAYVIYTSGSTGKPKGVMISHRAAMNLHAGLNAMIYANHPGEHLKVSLNAPLMFDASVQELVMLMDGHALYILPKDIRADGPALVEWIRRHQLNVLDCVPSQLQLMIDAGLLDGSGWAPQAILPGGEAISEMMWQTLAHAPATEFYNMYGPTECTVDSTIGQVSLHASKPVIGRPVPNASAYILDEQRQPVPLGVPGELYIGGAGVGLGYLNRPELTSERFLPDPFVEPGSRMYKTGDLCRYLPDGNIEYLGRLDHQVKVHGYRVELGEIEAALGAHPAISQAVVLMREDQPNLSRLVGYVVLSEGFKAITLNELRDHLKARLPEYMVPQAFVLLDKMPLTPNAKIDRKALPVPGGENTLEAAPEVDEQDSANRSQTEEIMAGIWANLLGLRGVAGHSNFFEIGGHSLMATQLISRVRSIFHIDLPLRTLFENPTLGDFSRAVEPYLRQGVTMSLEIPMTGYRSQAPLSFAQQRLLFLDQLEPGSPLNNITLPVRIRGHLDTAAFQASLKTIVSRHAILRTSFSLVEGVGLQTVAREVELPFEIVDLSGLDASDREAETERRMREEAQRPFDLSHAPLLRVTLFRLSADETIAVLVIHHIVSDGWSTGVLMRELSELYQAYTAGKPNPLPELAMQYADYAQWQREQLKGEVLEAQMAYWREQLDGCPTLLELPTDHPRPTLNHYRGAMLDFSLGHELSTALKDLSQREGVTMFMTLLAAFETLLYRYTGAEGFMVGSPIANRNQAAVEDLIGFFVNTLVLRADLSNQPTFCELLQRAREVCLGAYAHQDTPFELLVDALGGERDLSYSPLFQVMFVMQNTPQVPMNLPGVSLEPLHTDGGVAKFDLTLMMEDSADGLHAAFEYNTDLFEPATIQRMQANFVRLLEGLLQDPAQPIHRLPVLSDAERHLLLEAWNQTESAYPDQLCAYQLFEQFAAQTPDVPAVIFEGQAVSYAELNRQANQIAHFLVRQGVQREELIGLCLDRSVDMIAAILGVQKAGGAYIPLDPAYPPDRLAYMVADSGVKFLLTHNGLLKQIETGTARIIRLDEAARAIEMEPVDNLPGRAAPDSLAYVIYTSGSTGKPKGVLLEHRGLCNMACQYARVMQMGPGDRMLQFFSYSFDGSVADIFVPLSSGATLCIGRRESILPGMELIQFINQHQVTHGVLPPSALAALPREALPTLRVLLFGGEAMTRQILEPWAEGRRLINAYGPTEATVISTCYEVPNLFEENNNIPIGRPIANTTAYILDANLNPVPLGALGELYVSGRSIARGYLNRPELTAARFLPNPFNPTERLYKTGDLVRYRPNGVIEYQGRADDQVKIRGFRIELGEIESALQKHPGIKEVVVWVRGENGAKRLVAYYVPAANFAPLTVGELRAFLKDCLPDYMVPAQFVTLSALPISPNGKIDRKALPEPEPLRPELETAYIEPANETERTLAEIWQTLLSVERVGAADNFFELGGDSILSLQVIARARQKGLVLTAKMIFEHPTIGELAMFAGHESAPQAEQGPVSGAYPLTPIQQRFFNLPLRQAAHWNQSVMLQTPARLEAAPLQQALTALVNHHDALRSRFIQDASGIWQAEILPTGVSPRLETADLSALPESEQDEALSAACASLQASFDLSAAPLLTAGLFWLGAARGTRLFLAGHHLVIDTVSWRILLEDLAAALAQAQRGQAAALPAKSTSFKQWAHHLQSLANSAEIQDDLTFWQPLAFKQMQQLGISPFPQDEPADNNPEHTVCAASIQLTQAETEGLFHRAATALHCDHTDLLLSALSWAIRQWAGPISLPVQLERHGRDDAAAMTSNDESAVDVSRTVGWFTSAFPVVLDLREIDCLNNSLKHVRRTLRGLPHNGLSFGLLAAYHTNPAVRESLQILATPPVSFNYLGQFDGSLSGGGFSLAREDGGPERDPLSSRSHLLDITGGVTNGQLQMQIIYNPNIHHHATIQTLAQQFEHALRAFLTMEEQPEDDQLNSLEAISDVSLSADDMAGLMEEIGLDLETDDENIVGEYQLE